ncbi:NAD-dependent epimerase/dehydratase family protein [Streptococcus sp. X16XC17]|uniref:NAD-dependent epimerase/dehydratase family protein n=1 Tax=unclassified Streptococcus TaxID=2608887 RepID=UPI00066FFF03|nr:MULTISPECIES: NAD-dependent epimerase/dehydratase family protein [unclassified Streptococcus]TCD46262.1 NAD-dependent epimerase/dehydratase family protein [Streptococcus sp. X16XC17]
MKKVLITGANSYIGGSLITYLGNQPEYIFEELDVRTDSWKTFDFSRYDVIFHVAAIVHKNEKSVNPTLYDKVNKELPIELATIAKKSGVGQFIFLSSMSVYGNKEAVITQQTPENPSTFYGKSKLAAENGLKELDDNSFKVLIIRPPMVYGPKATGNYTRLSKLAQFTSIFPKFENQRSMIFIDNLSEFIKQGIDREVSGLFFPQNSEFVNTSQLVKMIREVNGKKTLLVSLLNPIVGALMSVNQINKMFGSLVYDKTISQYDFKYQIRSFEESIKLTEVV